MITTRKASWADDQQTLHDIRRTVFVVEQKVPPDLEWDGEDADCQHALATLDGRHVGTGRITPTGKIGRMAVLNEARGAGIGGALLQQLITLARDAGLKQVYLHAQTHALRFYERHGFVANGPEFDEADIPHRHMICKL